MTPVAQARGIESRAALPMKAVLLDRDGVINALVYHKDAGVIDSPFTRKQFKLLSGVPKAIRLLNDLGLHVAIVSNQPGVAKGRLSLQLLKAFETMMLSQIREEGGHVDRVYYCLHHPEARVRKLRQRCRCRKPEIGLLRRAAAELQVSLDECYMIGDGISDMLAGSRAGCRTIFVGRWKCEICQFAHSPQVRPLFVAKDLLEAAQIISSEVTGSSRSEYAPTCLSAQA